MFRRLGETVGGESGFGRKAVAAGSGFLLAALASGCGDSERAPELPTTTTTSPTEEVLDCVMDEGGRWTGVPGGLNLGRVADVLDVSVESVEAGSMGPIACDEAVLARDIDEGLIADVEGIVEHCQPVMILSNRPPEPGETYDRFGAICPAPDPAEGPVA